MSVASQMSNNSLDPSDSSLRFQLKPLFDVSLNAPCFVSADNVDQLGTALPTASSLYFSHSERREISKLDLQIANSITSIAHFNEPLTSLSVFPFTAHILVSLRDTAHILDSRQNYIAGSTHIQPGARCVPSRAPFQLYSIESRFIH